MSNLRLQDKAGAPQRPQNFQHFILHIIPSAHHQTSALWPSSHVGQDCLRPSAFVKAKVGQTEHRHLHLALLGWNFYRSYVHQRTLTVESSQNPIWSTSNMSCAQLLPWPHLWNWLCTKCLGIEVYLSCHGHGWWIGVGGSPLKPLQWNELDKYTPVPMNGTNGTSNLWLNGSYSRLSKSFK